MSRVLATNHDLPIRTDEPVHSGKVRSVYWLTPEDSARLIAERGYEVASNAELAVMVVSDRISAFDCIWQGEGGLAGVPGKGAAINAIAQYWFQCFRDAGLARSHILEVPHPLVWIVQRAAPVKIEGIARRYITGSLWRAYSAGEREFCGIRLPEGLLRNQRLSELLITPSSKGVLTGLSGIPEVDDVNISKADIQQHWQALGFRAATDIDRYEQLLREGFELIEDACARRGQVFVDTKFEFGYCETLDGGSEMVYMDEVGTPDSSRLWDAAALSEGRVVENSKEGFRQALLTLAQDPDILLNKDRMAERLEFAEQTLLPKAMLESVSGVYVDLAETLTGASLPVPVDPRGEIERLLAGEFKLC